VLLGGALTGAVEKIQGFSGDASHAETLCFGGGGSRRLPGDSPIFPASFSYGGKNILKSADHDTGQYGKDRSSDDPIGNAHIGKIHVVVSF
jgi:hypothetical protein